MDFGSSIAALRYDHGIDFAGTPPLPRRTPPVVWLVVSVLIAWSGMAALAWTIFPNGWRTIGLYFALHALSGLSPLPLGCTAVNHLCGGIRASRGARQATQAMAWRYRPARRRTGGSSGLFGPGFGHRLDRPPAAVLVLCLVVAVGAWVVLSPPRDRWGGSLVEVRTGQPVYAVPVRRVLALVTMLGSLLVFAVLLTACGGWLYDDPGADDTMPVTSRLGRFAAWLMPLLLVVVVLRCERHGDSDPARRTAPSRAREWL